MAEYFDSACRPFVAGAAIGKHLRVKFSSGQVVVAVAADFDDELGTTERETFAAGEEVSVRLRNAQGTRKMVANNAIAQGGLCYTAAAGKISSTSTSAFKVGIALEASAADGDVIEVLPFNGSE